MSRVPILMLACALVPAGALAAPDPQVLALRQQIAALQLDHALGLSPQQAQALLPQMQAAKAEVAAWRSQMTATQPARVAALTQAVADLKSAGVVSTATLQELQAARPAAPGTLRQDMRSFWQQARQVLSSGQLQALRSVNLGVGAQAAPSPSSSTGGGPRRHLRRFRVMRTLLSDDFVALVQARAG
ncbi:MAG TPA: hypothetical protein VMU15_05760 [Anaeromyxobacter sp.]|nr:hypothetical protein [Anaeromyxobacter sp.]